MNQIAPHVVTDKEAPSIPHQAAIEARPGEAITIKILAPANSNAAPFEWMTADQAGYTERAFSERCRAWKKSGAVRCFKDGRRWRYRFDNTQA